MPSHSTTLLRVALLSLILFGAYGTSHAQTLRRGVLLTITRFNFDCYPDTVFGDLEFPSMNSLPRVIRWGQAPASRDSSSNEGRGGGSGQRDQRQADMELPR